MTGGDRVTDLPWSMVQPVAVLNYPNEHLYTRVTEFKHLTGQDIVNRYAPRRSADDETPA